MKISKVFSKSMALTMLFSLISPFTVLLPRASAAALTWDGGGANDNWSTVENWSGDVAPVNGDSVIFDVSILTADVTTNNDIPNLNLSGISRNGDNSFNFTVTGNALTLSGPISGSTEVQGGQLFLEIDITLGTNISMSNTLNTFVQGVGSFNLSTYNLTINGDNSIGEAVVLTNLAGTGDINVESGTLNILGKEAGYSGDINVTGGRLNFNSSQALGENSSITVSDEGFLSILSDSEIMVPITIGGSGSNLYTPSLSLSLGSYTTDGPVIAGGFTLTSDINIFIAKDSEITEPIDLNGFTMTPVTGSSGVLSLPGNEELEVEAETIEIDEDDKSENFLSITNNQTVILNGQRGSTTVNEGGILKGTGTVGVLFVSPGGILAPGLSPGCLSSGNLTLNGNYEVEIAGTTVCDDYDQTDVTGTVDVTDGTLDLSLLDDFVPEINDEFVIINNDEDDEVTGEFADLAEGDSIEIDGITFEISYEGGDGNDVVLGVTSVPETVEAPDTGVATLLSSPLVTLFGALMVALTMFGLSKYARLNK